MKFLTTSTDYDKSIMIAPKNSNFTKPLLFHTLWDGPLNEKVYLSIKSCWFFHQAPNYTRTLWRTNPTPNEWDEKVATYCEVKGLDTDIPNDATTRIHILYKYGGCWFDPSMFFLRSLGPLVFSYPQFVMAYQSGDGTKLSGNLFISLKPSDPRLQTMLKDGLQPDIPIEGKGRLDDLLVFPCSWFDGASLDSKYMKKDRHFELFKALPPEMKPIGIRDWFKGSFAMSWRTEWDAPIEPNSVVAQLASQL